MIRTFFENFFPKRRPASLAAVSARVDETPGWGSLTQRPQDYDPALVQELYQDALAAWRKNPIAWRIIAITTDYVVGEKIEISSPNRSLQRFISAFWNHPQNRMDLRLEAMCDELSRSGDLFCLLFRNPQDGLSYLRFITKDRILQIETAENDWETELAYIEQGQAPGETRTWYSPAAPQAASAEAVCLHYAVNRPLGALLGEGDLTSMLPWLLRYSRMLEDRVRLNWAVRSFLWMVTVPANKVREKQEQYRTPPEAGSVIIKDESERWEAVTPMLHAAEAQHDLKAVRGMIDAGSGYPPHWRGEAADANLATASAMQAPTERHLLRRQRYFRYLLQDILLQAYQRAVEIGRARPLPGAAAGAGASPAGTANAGTASAGSAHAALLQVSAPDISRADNQALARAGRDMAEGLAALSGRLETMPPELGRLALELALKFAGETPDAARLQAVMEAFAERRSVHDQPNRPE